MFKGGVRVIGDIVVIAPFRATGRPVQFFDGGPQALDQPRECLFAHRSTARLNLRAGILLVRSGVQMDVGQQAKIQAGPSGQKTTGKIQRHTVNVHL